MKGIMDADQPTTAAGLFVPANYDPHPIPDGICDDGFPLLLIFREAADAMAVNELGFTAIGCPDAAGEQLARLLESGPRQDVVILADNDETHWRESRDKDSRLSFTPFWPGIEGVVGYEHKPRENASGIAEQIMHACGRLRFLVSPDGSKDLRQWYRDRKDKPGAPAVIAAFVSTAKDVTPAWLAKSRRWLADKKRAIELRAIELIDAEPDFDQLAALKAADGEIAAAGAGARQMVNGLLKAAERAKRTTRAA